MGCDNDRDTEIDPSKQLGFVEDELGVSEMSAFIESIAGRKGECNNLLAAAE